MKKSDNSRILRWVKKIKCLEYLNTYECKCGENNIVKLCFHHTNGEKYEKISRMRKLSFDKIKKELNNCEVMCQNCHQELHSKFDINESSKFKKINKKIFMEFLGKSNCEICGYDKCIDCLDFHHKIPENKTIEFRIFRNKINSISDISEHLKNELNSCQVICRNCHSDEHNGQYFSENKEEIFEKLRKFKGRQGKLPVDEIINMYKNGYKQVEIAKYFKASKGTISDIIKRNKLKIFTPNSNLE